MQPPAAARRWVGKAGPVLPARAAVPFLAALAAACYQFLAAILRRQPGPQPA